MITCLERIVDAADLLFDKVRLLYRTPKPFVLSAVESIRRKTKEVVNKDIKHDMS